jgi:hypothetical protein
VTDQPPPRPYYFEVVRFSDGENSIVMRYVTQKDYEDLKAENAKLRKQLSQEMIDKAA